MFRNFREDWQTMAVALLLAVLLWVVVRWGKTSSLFLLPPNGNGVAEGQVTP